MSKNLYIGFPVTLMIIIIVTFSYVAVQIKKKKIDIKDIAFWFMLNLIFAITVAYILVIEIIDSTTNLNVVNIFNWIAQNAFAFNFRGQEWIILLILGMISFVLLVSMLNTIRIKKLNNRVDELNKTVAILNGKINRTINFSELEIASAHKSLRQKKQELRAKIKLAKAQKKTKEKLKLITKTQRIKIRKKKSNQ